MSTAFGLCDACRYQRIVGNTRGSTFSLCGLSRTDDRFPKYPRMPVLRCVGFQRRDHDDAGAPAAHADRRPLTDRRGSA